MEPFSPCMSLRVRSSSLRHCSWTIPRTLSTFFLETGCFFAQPCRNRWPSCVSLASAFVLSFFGMGWVGLVGPNSAFFSRSRLWFLRLRFFCGTFRLNGRALFGLLLLLVLIPHCVFYRVETLFRCALFGEGSTIRHAKFVQGQLVSL